jgi:hypothetical protein
MLTLINGDHYRIEQRRAKNFFTVLTYYFAISFENISYLTEVKKTNFKLFFLIHFQPGKLIRKCDN